jgi:hypothetical protein
MDYSGHETLKKECVMNQTERPGFKKKQWEKPQLLNLSVEADTKTWFGGAQTDWSNTTATNTLAS